MSFLMLGDPCTSRPFLMWEYDIAQGHAEFLWISDRPVEDAGAVLTKLQQGLLRDCPFAYIVREPMQIGAGLPGCGEHYVLRLDGLRKLHVFLGAPLEDLDDVPGLHARLPKVQSVWLGSDVCRVGGMVGGLFRALPNAETLYVCSKDVPNGVPGSVDVVFLDDEEDDDEDDES